MRMRILAVLFVFLLATVSPTFAGDQKPFKAQMQIVDWLIPIPDDYQIPSYLYDIWEQNASWTPLFVYNQLLTFEGHTNVGGKTTSESPQLVYYFATGPEEDDPLMAVLFGYTEWTVANGDKIFSEFQAIFYQGAGISISAGPITGGTGRFEGATGYITGVHGFLKNGEPALILEGTIETVGEANAE